MACLMNTRSSGALTCQNRQKRSNHNVASSAHVCLSITGRGCRIRRRQTRTASWLAFGNSRTHTSALSQSSEQIETNQQPTSACENTDIGSSHKLETAWTFLKDFTIKSVRGLSSPLVATPDKRAHLARTILEVYHNPWPPAGWFPPTTAIRAHSTEDSRGDETDRTSSATQQGNTMTGDLQSSHSNKPQELTAEQQQQATAPLVMIGLMAGDVRMGARAMRDYCENLGLPYSKPESRVSGISNLASIQGPVYMKYNSLSKVCYVSPYHGKERGVLLQLGVEQLGHFPLGLWDEAMTRPPPSL